MILHDAGWGTYPYWTAEGKEEVGSLDFCRVFLMMAVRMAISSWHSCVRSLSRAVAKISHSARSRNQ